MQQQNQHGADTAIQQIKFDYAVNLPTFLKSTGLTLVMTNYQAHKLMIIGEHEGQLDIRYKNFQRPMGMYADGGHLWAGFGHMLWEFANFSSAAEKIEQGQHYDACYLPLNLHVTGDIDIHEMESIDNKLYFVNTKFSCLCTLEDHNSFKPFWKPPFISDLLPVDKCHLNGFCSREGKPRYVTALGKSDEPLGWRAHKADGGILMDIQSNRILLKGLSMPHSPRWYREKLWYLESGKGTLSYYDLATRQSTTVATVPGFTRGLHLLGDLAFIGVSKVRESATFSGLPITKLPKRVAGIWVVNITTGAIITFIEFTQGIDEVFAVAALPHRRMELFDFSHPLSHISYMVDDEDTRQVKMPEKPIELATPHFDKGNDLYTEGKKEEAISAFKKALEIQPDYLPATFNMAIAMGDLERYDEALEVLQEVIDKDASIAEAYNSLGYVHYKKGDLEQARENFEKALEINPDYQQARNSLSILLKELEQGESGGK